MCTQDSQKVMHNTNSATLPSYITFIAAQWYQAETMQWFCVTLSSKWLCPFSDGLNSREEAFVCLCYKQTVKWSSIKMHLRPTPSLSLLTRSVNIVMLELVKKKLMSNIFWAECDGGDSLHYELLVTSSLVFHSLWNLHPSHFHWIKVWFKEEK